MKCKDIRTGGACLKGGPEDDQILKISQIAQRIRRSHSSKQIDKIKCNLVIQ